MRYAVEMIKRFVAYKPLFFTFNSPDGYAANGYISGTKPPAKKENKLFAQVYKNLLEAHVQTYRAIKNDPKYMHASVGILKNMFQIDPWHIYNPLDLIASRIATQLTDTCFFDFFTTGSFNINIACLVRLPIKIMMR